MAVFPEPFKPLCHPNNILTTDRPSHYGFCKSLVDAERTRSGMLGRDPSMKKSVPTKLKSLAGTSCSQPIHARLFKARFVVLYSSSKSD